MQSRITESRRFTVDGYTVTFAAGVKRGEAVVVFGIITGLETVPVLTLEKKWSNLGEAESYVRRVTVIAAEKLLAHYQENYRAMTEKIDLVFSRPTTGFIAPVDARSHYPVRGRK
ncbi:hypothetical protein [Salmonella enterica]|uniref:hypothetical protein n=1 Tax=Salmonella enterica TaxID=28901 RepID=UPI0020C1EF94|nr:hypothetical protein [Salmonella enterica]